MWPSMDFSTGQTLLTGALVLVAALWVDKLLGEPTRFHPLVGFGRFANWVEKRCRCLAFLTERQQGILAWCLSVLPPTLLSTWLVTLLAQFSLVGFFLFNTLILYLTIGGKSLIEHANNIYLPLKSADIEEARFQVSMIVSRNTEKMEEKEITSSAIESVLENGNDAVIAPMFWFIVLGVPGAVLFRLANTLDAMWGYKNERYLDFGRFTAKTDDVLGWAPAKITALLYALQGNFSGAIFCWRTQAKECSSPNGGVVMTAGAGALNVTIGGPTYYHGVLHDKKSMGTGRIATWETIPLANQLVSRGSLALSYLWLVTVLVGVS
ncbi:adenosylcobinamide-phosphate synthase CbiB [Vibrio algarum]|uniref:Cobalamin biosynthesis protein CobD n=1 Tax=Vibrio algarum TaxID=3020714 RepID=A0ABT4YUU4_9VIBR|nr:adenosylcobinamide-phosphate synthase CbiB [Vibrio sp. KJ40-1]MDB1125130.1 adenosylcobinamide-phosphate synthase CbiB [Vibrio sp. KJ40-1]